MEEPVLGVIKQVDEHEVEREGTPQADVEAAREIRPLHRQHACRDEIASGGYGDALKGKAGQIEEVVGPRCN